MKCGYILTKNDGTYLGWSRADKVKKAGHGMKWVEWGKELPGDIDEEPGAYKHTSGKLTKVK